MARRFLDELARRRWEWGEWDCTMAVARWIEEARGIDPLKEFRGRYETAEEAREVVRKAGGFLPTIGHRFDAAGLARTQTYETGDVAAVKAGIDERQILPVVGAIMAIRLDDLWIAKSLHGICGRPFPVITAWRV